LEDAAEGARDQRNIVLMRWRHGFAFAAACAIGVACVDVFHGTDFTTLCVATPSACSDAGVSRLPPLPDFCSFSPAEAQRHAERACAFLGACRGATEATSFGACMLRALAAYDCKLNPALRPRGPNKDLWACLGSVGSCGEVDACLFGDAAPPTCGPVSGGTFRACADGRSLIECGLPAATNPPVAVEPCTFEGRGCLEIDGTRALCVGKAGATCTGPDRCDGTSAIRCDGTSVTADIGVDCAAFGFGVCVTDDAGIACAPAADTPSCTGTSELRCDDAGVARACVAGHELAFDCSRLGLVCATSAETRAIAPITACGPRPEGRCDAPDTCSGDLLRSCARGRAFTLACSSLGLKPCTVPTIGTPIATCARP
jgi:hypothetical protein